MSVLVFADSQNGKLAKPTAETVYYASQIASTTGGDVHVITYGSIPAESLAELGAYGAAKVWIYKGLQQANDEQLAALVEQAANATGAKTIVFAFDQVGKMVAPRLSAKMKAGYVPGAIALPTISGNRFVVKKNVFSGKAIAHYAIETDVKVIALLANSVKPLKGSGTAAVTDFDATLPAARVRTKEVKSTVKDGIPLPEAERVVSAGRGLKGPENWGIVEELAKTLDAATACSRPVADIGWRPHHEHVGQTGIAIRPNLYIAAGISGAIQHLAGVNGSKTIVVINTDPEAPFFKAADYGVVGDAFEVLPRLTEAIKKFKAAN
jgi:electron transfer flavoprotein alpha subunit